MATSFDMELEEFIVNDVASDELAEELAEAGKFKEGQFITTPDEVDSPFMPIGSIFASAIPQTDARVHLLDGSVIQQDGVYADFVNLVKSLVSAGYNIACLESEYDEDIRKTGNCGRFIINSDSIRLPTITTFIQGLSDLTDLTDIGSSLSAGIPNIKGSTSVRSGYGTFSAQNAFITSGVYGADSESGSSSERGLLTFDASKGEIKKDGTYKNDVYGNSDTVQPPATRYPYYIVLASGYKSSSQVNIDNYVTELNGKLAKAEIKRYPIETYNDGNVKYTIYNDGFKTCSGVVWTNQTVSSSSELNVTLTLPVAFESNYTVVYNGTQYIISLGSHNHSKQSCTLRFGGYQGSRTLNRYDWYVEGY